MRPAHEHVSTALQTAQRRRGGPIARKALTPATLLALRSSTISHVRALKYGPMLMRARFAMQGVVMGPLGFPLTRADLPVPGRLRWCARRKAEVVAAVEGGLLSTASACALYALSLDELLSWQRTLARYGLRGLQIRALSERQHRFSSTQPQTA